MATGNARLLLVVVLIATTLWSSAAGAEADDHVPLPPGVSGAGEEAADDRGRHADDSQHLGAMAEKARKAAAEEREARLAVHKAHGEAHLASDDAAKYHFSRQAAGGPASVAGSKASAAASTPDVDWLQAALLTVIFGIPAVTAVRQLHSRR
jgi:hypothetical protein